MRRARTTVFAATVVVWLATCVWFWRRLIEQAADSGDLYARSAAFQVLNFVWQYLWVFVLALGLVLALEWTLFRILARFQKPKSV